MKDSEFERDIKRIIVWERVWILLKVFVHFSSAVPLLNSLCLLPSLSDPLEMKTSASAEWSGSHKGMNTHIFLFICVPVSLCAFVSPCVRA